MTGPGARERDRALARPEAHRYQRAGPSPGTPGRGPNNERPLREERPEERVAPRGFDLVPPRDGVELCPGADAPGKQELEADILKDAKIVVDDYTQASHSGEINVPLSKGLITTRDIYGSLGEIVANKKAGRVNNEEITIFDSTGLAVLDIICARLVYEKAKKVRGCWLPLN